MGDVIDGRFEVLEPLGKGAFASVWRATDRANGGREVALKLLLEQHASDEKKLKRFVQEAKILERLEHPNIAKAIAWSAAPGGAYLAMELVDGETLDARLREHAERASPLPKEGIAWICDQLTAAIAFAHAETIVHRDLKPRNVMISRRGQRPFLKVLDFGIAKVLLGSELDPTTVGKVLGSVLYIAPEQVLGRPVDNHRADVFSLGTILFEVLTLRRAWARDAGGRPLSWAKRLEDGEDNSQIAVLRRIARDPRPRPTESRPELPPAVDQVLARALAIDPDARFDSAAAFATELRLALFAARSMIPEVPMRTAGTTRDPAEPAAPPAILAATEAPAEPDRPRALPSFRSSRDAGPRARLLAASELAGGEDDTLRAPLHPSEPTALRSRARADDAEVHVPADGASLEAPPISAPGGVAGERAIVREPTPDELADTYRRRPKRSGLAVWGAALLVGALVVAAAAWLYLRA